MTDWDKRVSETAMIYLYKDTYADDDMVERFIAGANFAREELERPGHRTLYVCQNCGNIPIWNTEAPLLDQIEALRQQMDTTRDDRNKLDEANIRLNHEVTTLRQQCEAMAEALEDLIIIHSNESTKTTCCEMEEIASKAFDSYQKFKEGGK